MAKILGIDLGTNSAGWSMIDNTTNEIIETGVRIFPEGVNKDQSGSESPKNLERRTAKGIRKNNYRYKLRRNKLKRVLSELEMTPDKRYFTNEKNKNYTTDEKGRKIKIKKNFTYELYELRDKALTQKLSLGELGRIFYHLNTHRGFKSNAKEKAILHFTDDKKKKDVQGTVEKSYSELQKKIDEAREKGFIKHGTIGEYFFSLIKQNSQSHNINEPISKIRNNDNQEGHYTLRKMYEDEFDLIWDIQKKFHNGIDIFNDENKIRIKNETIFYQRDLRSSKHLIGRCPLEFKSYVKIEKEKKIVEKSYLPCCSNSSMLFQEYRIWESLNNLRYRHNDSDWLSLTQGEKRKFADFLEYEDSVFVNMPDKRYKLSKEERKEIENKIKYILEYLALPQTSIFNINKILGNRTVYRLVSAIGKDTWNNLPVKENHEATAKKTIIEEFIDPVTGEIVKYPAVSKYTMAQQNLWHIIDFSSNFTNSQDWILGNVKKKNSAHIETFKELKLEPNQIQKLSEVYFEPDYAAYSSKAISKLLPFLKAEYKKHQAEEIVYKKMNSDIRTNDNNLLDTVPLLPNNYLRNPIVQQGANEIIRLINSIIATDKLGKPDEVRIELTRELKKPRQLREQQKRNNDSKEAERKKYSDFLSKKLNQFVAPKDSRIGKFEFWLELAWSKKAFDEVKEDISLKEFEEFCKDMDNPKIKDYEKKYQLWLECGRILPYEPTKVIGLEELFSPEIEIEHIIPYSRCFDDSFMNKTLSTKSFNNKKGKQTPLEYFASCPKKEFEEFKRQIKDFPEGKKKRFLLKTDEVDTFKNSQLNNTAYVTTILTEHLRKTFRADQIKITSGAITSIMRSIFGFNTLLNKPIKATGYENGAYWVVFDSANNLFTLIEKVNNDAPEYDKEYTVISGYVNNEYLRIGKTRNDHRHHAVDAIAIAYTNQRMIQFISTITEGYFEKDGLRVPDNTENSIFSSAFDENGKFTETVWNAIMEEAQKHYNIKSIRREAKEKVSDILVSHRLDNKLTSSGRKKIYLPSGKPKKEPNKDGEKVQFYSGGDVARGQLHEATLYGKIHYNQLKDERKSDWMKRDGIFVYRVPLKYSTKGFFSKIEQLEKIVDPVIRKITTDAVNSKGLKEALNEGIYLPIKDKKTKEVLIEKAIKIKSIRIASDSRELNSIRSFKEEKKDYKKAYIETGKNYLLAIYGVRNDDKSFKSGSGDCLLINFFNAVKQKLKTNQIDIPKNHNKKELICSITKGQHILYYQKHPDEIIWNDRSDLYDRLYIIREIALQVDHKRGYEYGVIKSVKHNYSKKPTDSYIDGKINFEKQENCMKQTNNQFTALVEDIDFKIDRLGEIIPIK